MNTLEQLAVALGLAGLAGINLYLTVFVTGLAIRLEWIHLAAQYQQLSILGETPIVVIAGILYVLEFFADKVPWIDSINDAVHTVIRPIGAAFVAIQVLGSPQPVFDVIIGLLAGSVALTTHTAKAGTRLLANASPEPFSNIALSVTEDAMVVGGLVLLNTHPFIAFALLLAVLGLIVYFGPKILRCIKVRLWLGWRKLKAPAAEEGESALPTKISPEADMLFSISNPLHEKPEWAVPCISGSGRRIPSNLFGWLIGTAEQPDAIHFVAKGGGRDISQTIELSGYRVGHESRFLTDDLVLYRPGTRKGRYVFLFDRAGKALCQCLAAELERRIATAKE